MFRQISAMDTRRGIATDTGIPWHLPGDVAYFREQTSTGNIVMGRATYEEFDAPLHGRDNFVLTSSLEPLRDGFKPVANLDELSQDTSGADVWVIGGAGVYASTIARTDELLITQVFGDFHCTKFFPAYEGEFTLVDAGEEKQEADVRYRFERWQRIGATKPIRTPAT
jgi:dihydrofolate reductase